MSGYSQWFHEQLQHSANGFVWGTEQVPEARRYAQPPKGLGEWTVARHVFHLWYYEQTIAVPSMQQWLGGTIPFLDDQDEDLDWGKTQGTVEDLLEKFKTVRAQQIGLLSKFDDSTWNATREAVWGPVTLLWVVSKTYQHTAEHTNDVMRIWAVLGCIPGGLTGRRSARCDRREPWRCSSGQGHLPLQGEAGGGAVAPSWQGMEKTCGI